MVTQSSLFECKSFVCEVGFVMRVALGPFGK
jgi:hypothetical protein